MEDNKKDRKPIPWSKATAGMRENVRRMLKEGLTFSWADDRPDKTIKYTDEQIDTLFRGEDLPLK